MTGEGASTATEERPTSRRSRALQRQVVTLPTRAVSQWAAAFAVMLLALRPLWTIPIQADDFLTLFDIYANGDDDILGRSLRNAARWAAQSDSHFNPVGIFLETLLKGLMMTTTSSTFTAGTIHHTALSGLMLLALPISARLAGRLIRVTTGATVSPSALAIPVAVGFAMSIQVTAPWSMFDPLVAHPIFSALPTVLGLAYLASGLGALGADTLRRRVVMASAIGVLGFLVYEIMIVFVAAFVVIALATRRRHTAALWARLPWLAGPPMATFVIGQAIVASHPDSGYAGTSLELSRAILPSWFVAMRTGEPGVLWGLAFTRVDAGRLVPYAVVGAVLTGALLAGWALIHRRATLAIAPEATGSHLRALLPLALLAALAPAPYLVSAMWRSVLLTPGTTYMHSLTMLWSWAMAIGVVLWWLVRMQPSRRWIAVGVIAVMAWVGVQLSINRQLAASLTARPTMGVDVSAALTDGADWPEADRCASLAQVGAHPLGPMWIGVMNREFEERYGEAYCDSPDIPTIPAGD